MVWCNLVTAITIRNSKVFHMVYSYECVNYFHRHWYLRSGTKIPCMHFERSEYVQFDRRFLIIIIDMKRLIDDTGTTWWSVSFIPVGVVDDIGTLRWFSFVKSRISGKKPTQWQHDNTALLHHSPNTQSPISSSLSRNCVYELLIGYSAYTVAISYITTPALYFLILTYSQVLHHLFWSPVYTSGTFIYYNLR